MRSTFYLNALLGVAVGSSTAVAAEPTDARPNILMIAVDDLNHWVGHLDRNAQTATPHIDQLAAQGVAFRHSYCAAPLCNPSRAALMSGLRPSTTGVYQNNQDWRPAVPEELTLPSTFRRAGYFVAGAGKIYHGGQTRRSEWDDYLVERRHDPVPAGDKGVGGIKFAPLDCQDEDLVEWAIADYGIEQLQKSYDKPFFLAIGFHKPHMPWNVPRKYYDMHPLDSIELPPTHPDDLADVPSAGKKMAGAMGDHKRIVESGRWKEAIQAYLASISYADAMIGRLLDGLEQSAYRDNTIVLLWGDHGWHLGEKEHWRKFTLWEEATRAPLVWVVPGVTKPGTVCDWPVDLMSIYPTLTDLAGVPTPPHVEGRSLRPLLADPTAERREPAITTYGLANHAVRTDGWRYIRYADGSEELYDEAADPYEWTNVAALPEHTQRKAELAKLLPQNDAEAVASKGTAEQLERRRLRRQRRGIEN